MPKIGTHQKKECELEAGYLNLVKLDEVEIFNKGENIEVASKTSFPIPLESQSLNDSYVHGVGSVDVHAQQRSVVRANYDSSKASGFVQKVKARVVGFLGKCWKYVNDAITGVKGKRMGGWASQFVQQWSDTSMKKVFGLCKLVRPDGVLEKLVGRAPIGAVIGFSPGKHGFSKSYGHGEIKVSEKRYCSDGCAVRSETFTASFILYPCK